MRNSAFDPAVRVALAIGGGPRRRSRLALERLKKPDVSNLRWGYFSRKIPRCQEKEYAVAGLFRRKGGGFGPGSLRPLGQGVQETLGKYSSTKSTAPTVQVRPLRGSKQPASVVKRKESCQEHRAWPLVRAVLLVLPARPYFPSPKRGWPAAANWARIWWVRPVTRRQATRDSPFPPGQGAVEGDGGAPPGHRLFVDGDLLFGLVF